MNNHNMNNIPAIGLVIHLGDEPKNYIKDILKINSKVFNEIYFVGNEYKDAPSNIHFIPESVARDYLSTIIPKEVKLTPYRIADLLTPNSIDFLVKATGRVCIKKVFKFDTDFVVFNKALIWRLFDKYEHDFYSIESNVYPRYKNEGLSDFLNVAMSFITLYDRKNTKLITDHMIECALNNPDKYTATGPSALNSLPDKIIDELRSNFPSNYNIKDLRNPNTEVIVDEYTIGVHLEASVWMYTNLNGELNDFNVKIEGNKIITY